MFLTLGIINTEDIKKNNNNDNLIILIGNTTLDSGDESYFSLKLNITIPDTGVVLALRWRPLCWRARKQK